MSHKPLFAVLGVPVTVRPIALLPGSLLGTLAYAIARRRAYNQRDALALGLANLLLWYKADLIHIAGHILSARASDAPMDFVDWRILAINGYRKHDVTPQQHIGRSIGGPIASGVTAILYWLLWRRLTGKLPAAVVASGLIYNALIAIVSLAPLPVVDGGVIYKNLRKL